MEEKEYLKLVTKSCLDAISFLAPKPHEVEGVTCISNEVIFSMKTGELVIVKLIKQ